MVSGDVSLVCYVGGKLINGDKNAKYIGGSTKGVFVPNNIEFASFKEKIQEIVNIPLNGIDFEIKCGVRFDKSTLIAFDVDDDQSLRFVMDHSKNSKVIMAYIIEHLPTATTYTTTLREEDPFPSLAGTREDPVLRTADNQNQTKNLMDRTSIHKSIELGSFEVNTNTRSLPSESKLREWFPEKLVPLITGCENPLGDGNCGFRALCMALTKNENKWDWMRYRLVKEIESNKGIYNLLFGIGETDALLKRTSHLQGSALTPNWMDMPNTGFVFAQAFEVVLVHYSKNNCFTFVPSLSPPSSDNVKVLGIGLVENNHYIKLDFEDGCPLPPFPHTPSKWRTICSVIFNSWEEILAPRLLACRMMNVPELQIEKCFVPIVLDGEDRVSPSAPIQNVNEHGDVNFIDISKAEINPLEDTHHRFSQSNIDSQDGVMNLLISNQEDDDGGDVNMQNMLSEENQFSSQMEETAALPVCIQTSSRICLSDNDFDVNREYESIEAFRNSLTDWAVKTGHEYRPVRKTPSKLTMKCVSEGCKWYIRVSQLPNLSTFKVVKYQGEHSCSGPQRSCGGGDHRQATIKWIVSKMQSSIEKDPEIEPMKIVKEIKNKFGIKISYNKAVKTKTRVLEVMRNHQDPIHMLEKELEQNGSVVEVGFNSDGSFQHLFWAFQACIDALRNHLRPVVRVGSVDTKIGILMFAYGVDGKNFCGDPIEVGFAVCVREDEESWERYLGWLKECVLPPPTAAAAGIPFSIVTNVEKTSLTRAVECVLPHLHHFFLPSSVESVFLSEKFEGDNLFLSDLCCEVCTSFSTEVCEENLQENDLYDLCIEACISFSTEKCEEALQEIKSEKKEAYSWLMSVGSRSHWAIAFSPNKHALAVPWGVAFYWNLKSIGEKPSIVEMVERSRKEVANYFSERRIKGEEAATTTTTGLAPLVMKDIQWAKSFSADCEVESISRHKYKVTYFHRCQEVVDLEEKSCTCGKFQAKEYPCKHALILIAHLDLDVRNYLSQHQWYSLETYLATYAGSLPPPLSDHILQRVPPKRGRGRPPKRAAKKINLVGRSNLVLDYLFMKTYL